ncbi:MAG: ABC transporter substrate-binding protein [Spirochaetales bacterium]|uniref:ABC transporter substrate-binding protein n=1 Tax=Candidatus Thalassospirochaeta sargassi TaxID=3119039 RepID=A0AAJ1IF90_9SPIO|nr:ABC transporter substrate-binding protein [Spirochaetales bacterium]
MKHNKFLPITVFVFFTVLLTSCVGEKSVTIAEQYGLAYAPLQIMRAQGYFEELSPGVEIEWVKLGNTAAIREAVLAGEVDLGFMGLPPFLLGLDKGMDWKLIAGLSICPVGLVAGDDVLSGVFNNPLDAIKPGARIALPQPGSIQHILLSMASERLYGDASRFDGGLVTMKHPDGMTALISGSVDAHFTSPPYIFMENEATAADGGGFTTVLSGDEAFGGSFSFIGAMATDSFLAEDPELVEGFLQALEKSIDFINTKPEETAVILASAYDMPEEEVLKYISRDDMIFTSTVYGLEQFISFMTGQGYITGISASDAVAAGVAVE